MKMTPAMINALKTILEIEQLRGSYNKHANAGTRCAIRTPILEKLEKAGMITSDRPFAGSYHTVKLTEAGRQACALS